MTMIGASSLYMYNGSFIKIRQWLQNWFGVFVSTLALFHKRIQQLDISKIQTRLLGEEKLRKHE